MELSILSLLNSYVTHCSLISTSHWLAMEIIRNELSYIVLLSTKNYLSR